MKFASCSDDLQWASKEHGVFSSFISLVSCHLHEHTSQPALFCNKVKIRVCFCICHILLHLPMHLAFMSASQVPNFVVSPLGSIIQTHDPGSLIYMCIQRVRHDLFWLSHQSCNRCHRKPSASLLFSWNSIAPGPSLEASAETPVSLFDSKHISLSSVIEMYFGSVHSHSCSAPSWQGLVTVAQASQFLLSHLGWIFPGA